tara:strand:+ start:9140 stop:10390 length:1251 start_codon:yes stop_codon:yes gene_type:complete
MVVMISNGPGELSTWVKPLAEKLHSKLIMKPRHKDAEISLRLVLVPCPNSTGQEKQAAESWQQFDKITSSKNFWHLLIHPKKYGLWPSKGLVIFLGGDQFWSVLLSARLGYLNMSYCEWVARWPYWNDRIAAMTNSVKMQIPKRVRKRCIVVGDLMGDINENSEQTNPLPKAQWVALLPGSKKAKLIIGIPFFLELADRLSILLPNCKFLLPVAPTTSLEEFIAVSSSSNPLSKEYSSKIKRIEDPDNEINLRKLITNNGTKIYLKEDYPAHEYLRQCDLALTTVGANTAELAALTVPMIVILPTQHISVMQAWDGLIGVIARLPLFKFFLGIAISLWRLRKQKFVAWPNISASKMIVPERIGNILPKEIANESYTWLCSPKRLRGQKEDLQRLRGKAGAIEKMSNEIIKLINEKL